MPRIPEYQPQGGVPVASSAPGQSTLPSLPSMRLPTIEYSKGAAEAMANTGLELARTGQILSLIAENRRKADQAITVMERETGFLTELQDTKRKLISDPTQYESVLNSTPKILSELQNKHLEGITDPDVRNVLKKSMLHPILSAQSEVVQWGNKQRVDRGMAATDASVNQLQKLYMQAGRDDEKAQILGRIQGTLDAAAQAGFISRDKAGESWRKVQDDLMEAEVMQMGRTNPQATRDRLLDSNFAPGLDPKRREAMIRTFDTKIDQMQRRAEMLQLRELREADKRDREADKDQKKFFDANYARAAALQAENKLTINDINSMAEKRQIDPDGYNKLMQRHGRDMEKYINEAEADIAKNFRTTGFGAASMDSGNEAYISDLQKELRDRTRKGENIEDVRTEIISRERELKPQNFNSIPKPKFIDGPYQEFDKPDDIKLFMDRLNKAQEKTAQMSQSGQIDSDTGKREMQRIKDLKQWAEKHLMERENHYKKYPKDMEKK